MDGQVVQRIFAEFRCCRNQFYTFCCKTPNDSLPPVLGKIIYRK